MAVSSIKDFWIHPNALTITLNYFGDPQLIQTSMLAGAVIMAYRKDVITYDAAHNFREWKLQAFPTQLNDTCAYYVHAELSRSGDTAMIIYSPVKRDIEGRTLLRVEKDENGRDVEVWDETTSTESYFIYLGTISASVDNDGSTVERAWTDGFYTGTLDTDQQRMEEASGEWAKMFNYNSVTQQIEPQKPFANIKVMGEAIFQSIAQFVNGLVIGKRTITDVAASSDSGNESKVSDATLPTTGYVQKEIEALDDHFLIKDDPDNNQSVSGPVTFEQDVTVEGDHVIGGNQTIQGTQEVKGLQTLHEGFKTAGFSNVGGTITGAQLTGAGVMTLEGIVANSFKITELIYNVIRAQGGKTVLSNAATVESVAIKLNTSEDLVDTYDGNTNNIDYVLLTIKADEHNKGANPFKVGDILYGYVNNIGESGAVSAGGECTMRVTEELNDMMVKAEMYTINTALTSEDSEYYDHVGSNIAPTPNMALAQRGSTTDKSRRTSFFLDAQSGNIVMLQDVTTPRIKMGYYGTINGILPSDLYNDVYNVFAGLKPTDPVMFGKYGIFQNLIQYDHQGNFLQRENHRGAWSASEEYDNNPSYYDSVTDEGQLWKCLKKNKNVKPTEGEYWMLLVAKGDNGPSTVIYEIETSPSSINMQDGVLNTSSLSVNVNRNVGSQVSVIRDSEMLAEYGYKMKMRIDYGQWQDIQLINNSDDYLTLDDETAIELPDGNNIQVESTVVDLDSVRSQVEFAIVDMLTEEIKITKAVSVNRNQITYSLVADDDSVQVDFIQKDGIYVSANDVNQSIYVYLYEGRQQLNISDSAYQLKLDRGDASYPDYSISKADNIRWKLDIVIPQGTAFDDCACTLKLKATHNDSEYYCTVSIGRLRAGESIQGEAGPFIYHAGELRIGMEISPIFGDNGNIVAKPLYLWKNSVGKQYYVVESDSKFVFDDAAKLGDTDYFRPLSDLKYVFAEILMAEWANLASAYFHGDYMFSDVGYTIDNGEERISTVSNHIGGDKPMFSDIGEWIPENFTPNFMINLRTGHLIARDASIRGNVNATSGTFTGRVEVFGNGSIVAGGNEINGNGSISLGKGNIVVSSDGSGNIGKGVLMWNEEGIVLRRTTPIDLWIDVSSKITDPDWFGYLGNFGDAKKYLLPVDRGSYFLLGTNTDAESEYIVLPVVTSNVGTIEDGYIAHSLFSIVLRYNNYTRSAVIPHRLLATEGNPIWVRSTTEGIVKLTNKLIEIPPNKNVEVSYVYDIAQEIWRWTIDENDCDVYEP